MRTIANSFTLALPTGRHRASSRTERIIRLWRLHSYILPALAVATLVCAWFCTWGDWRFFEPEEFCGFYDAQATSLLDGRLDVAPAAIGTEAFIVNGKTYGYFGVGPAILRLPLVIAFDGMDGRWSRLMMMIASTTNLACAYAILRLVRGRRDAITPREKWLHSLFIVAAGIGSTNIFLVARSFTFHEAIMWAATFALLFAWALLKYLARPTGRMLGLAGLFGCMSFLSRPTVGAGALFGLSVLWLALVWSAVRDPKLPRRLFGFRSPARPLRHSFLVVAVVLLTLGVYFGVNYAKFRSFDGVPLKYYYYYKVMPARMQITGGKQIHAENIPSAMASYFGFRGLHLINRFPWLDRTRDASFIGTPAIDMVDGFSTFPVSMPAVTLLAAIGAGSLALGRGQMNRRLRLPGIVLLIGGSIVLATVALCERYLHDFFPALIVLAGAGVCRLARTKVSCWSIAGLAVLTFVSIAINCSFALLHQRSTAGAPPAKVAEFRQWQRTVDGWLHPSSIPTSRVAN